MPPIPTKTPTISTAKPSTPDPTYPADPTQKPTGSPTTSNPSAYPSLDPTFEPTLPSNTCCGCLSVASNINNGSGCELDTICEANICKMDEWCCNTHWDRKCVDAATSICTSQTKQPSVSPTRAPVIPCCGCTNARDSSGCYKDFACQTNICGNDPYCCSTEWDGICAKYAEKVCEFNTFLPSMSPTQRTHSPTLNPTTASPSASPTKPTAIPSSTPTQTTYSPVPTWPIKPKPTSKYSNYPTKIGTLAFPTPAPSCVSFPGFPGNCDSFVTVPLPTPTPTDRPTKYPTPSPTPSPTAVPSFDPSFTPTTSQPTTDPTSSPSFSPTAKPTDSPHTPGEPSRAPSFPTNQPSKFPSRDPTSFPSVEPTVDPTEMPTTSPFKIPTLEPTLDPTATEVVHSGNDGSVSDAANSSYSNESSHEPALWIEGICLVVTSALSFITLYFFFCKKEERKLKKSNQVVALIKFPVVLALFFNFVGVSCAMGTSFILYTNGSYDIGRSLYFALTISYTIGKVFMEIFFIVRLYTSFKKSSFALSHHTLIESAILIIAISTLWVYTWLSDQSKIFTQWIALSAEIFLICWLLILFVGRLSKLILLQKTDKQQSIEMSTTKSMPTVSRLNSSTPSAQSPSAVSPSTTAVFNVGSDTEDDDSARSPRYSVKRQHTITSAAEMQLTLSGTQQKLIYVITRSIVLSSIAMITTILFSVYAFFYVSSGMNGLFILYILWTLDMTANSICIFLNFKHSKSSYERYCGLCHGCIQFLIRRCSAKQIINDNARRLDSCPTRASTTLKPNQSNINENNI